MLRTKLTVLPYRSGLIFRPKLITYLKSGFDRGVRLILISAPAGSGKSTLVSEWAAHYRCDSASPSEQPSIQFAWLSLDTADNEKLRFLLYLIGAIQSVHPELDRNEQRILSFSKNPPVESILIGLLNQIGALSNRLVLVLDDYHLIIESSIHDSITFILEHMPGNMQVVITTRADPPLPLSRLRVRNQLLEIRSADLFFTYLEAETLINDIMGLGLSADDLAMLEERTEGWAAGVQLVAILLMDERSKVEQTQGADQVEKHLSALVARLSGRQHLIADYLVDEVLNRQPVEVQRFLLETSIVDELCASLCDTVINDEAGKPTAQSILEYLERANLFLIPLDEERTWFRYHHLFVDALRIRLELSQPGAGITLHKRASKWYEENGFTVEAIEHALAGQDYEFAARQIETNIDFFARQGRYGILIGWLAVIPAEIALAHPHLILLCSRALVLSGKLSGAEQLLLSIEKAAATSSESGWLTPELRGQIAAVRAIAAILNADPALAKEQSQLAMDLLPRSDPSLAGVMLISGDAALMTGQIPRGIQLLRDSIIHCRHNNGLDILLTTFDHLCEGLWMQGSLHEVKTICLEALDEVNIQLGAGSSPLSSLSLIYTHLGGIKREWNDLAGAEEALTQAVGIVENCGDLSSLVKTYAGMAALRRSQGNITQSIELIEKGMQAINMRESGLFFEMYQALRAEYWVLSGNLLAARRWAEERKLSAGRAIDYLGEFELHTLTRLWIADERPDEADALAGRLIAFAESSGQVGKAISYLVLQALARRAAGRLVLALQSLGSALVLGEPEGYIRTFLDEGEPLFDLLRRISRQKKLSSAYSHLLLSKAGTSSAPEKELTPSHSPHKPLIETLTERELAVLRQVAKGSSNQEIGLRLVISEGTVKAHIYHITAKLGARSRTEAVARAREAGLIP